MKKINFLEKFSKFNELWSPKVIAEINDYQFKLAKIKNDFIWHSHEETDETFIVIKGSMSIEFENETIKLNEGEMIIQFYGIHEYIMLEDSIVIETKNGPYCGQEKDRTRVEIG